jgi:uncharacterized protein (DUF111 family)
MIHPCQTDQVRNEAYKKMLETSKELYDYFTSGKKNKDGNTLKAIKEEEKAKQDARPPWRSTGVSNVPSWSKPSKYQMNSNIKAKVYTGLPDRPQDQKLEKGKTSDEQQNIVQDEMISLSDHEFTIDENGDIII